MTQGDRIIRYLLTHSAITPIKAFEELGITKLSTRISELKRRGYHFGQTMVDVTNRYGEKRRVMCYWLTRERGKE